MNAIIFDFDGTIADSFEYVLPFLLKKAHRSGVLSDAEKAELHNLSMKDLALKVGIPAWRLPLVFFQGEAAMSKFINKTQPFNGMAEVLAALKRDGYQLYIISSNSQRNVTKFLVEHGLSGYFIKVYSGAGWFGKARALRKALKQNHLSKEATVYVGDEVRDVVGAKTVGMPSVAVSWGFSSAEQLSQHAPMVVVHTPAELQKVLQEWGKTI